MPESRVQLRIEVETEGAEQLTSLRQELDLLAQTGTRTTTQLDSGFAGVLDKLRLARSLVADSTRSFLDAQRQLFAGLAPMFDSFFRNVFTGTRSLRDSLKRLWQQFLEFFLGIVRQMLAAWLGGLQAMTGAHWPRNFGAFGGGFGGLLATIFGLPGLGGTPPFIPAAGLSLLSAGLGYRLGLGGTPPIFPYPTAGGTLAGLLGLVGLGVAGVGVRRGSVALGALGGALTGWGFGTALGGALGGAFGAFGGPIGAIIGGIIGAIAAWIKRGKLKRQASRIADQGFAEMQKVLQQFRAFQIEYEQAIAQVTQIWQQMVNAWSRMGSIGRRSLRGQEPWFRQVLAEIDRIQKAREARRLVVEALPVPEFQFGGIVRAISAWNGRVLAVLHQGEAVLTRRAAQALGEENITRLNRGQSRLVGSTGDQFYITINAVDGESVERWLSRNDARLVRFLRRAAGDRGLRPPV